MASQDVQTSPALKMAELVDQDRSRTIGVLTKVHHPKRESEISYEKRIELSGNEAYCTNPLI